LSDAALRVGTEGQADFARPCNCAPRIGQMIENQVRTNMDEKQLAAIWT
jgi:hypothetical protein